MSAFPALDANVGHQIADNRDVIHDIIRVVVFAFDTTLALLHFPLTEEKHNWILSRIYQSCPMATCRKT